MQSPAAARRPRLVPLPLWKLWMGQQDAHPNAAAQVTCYSTIIVSGDASILACLVLAIGHRPAGANPKWRRQSFLWDSDVLPPDVAPYRLGNPRPRSLLAARAALPSHT